MEISKANERAISSLPAELQKILQTDINEAIKERIRVLKQVARGEKSPTLAV